MRPYELEENLSIYLLRLQNKSIGQRFASHLLLLHFQFPKLIQKAKRQQVL